MRQRQKVQEISIEASDSDASIFFELPHKKNKTYTLPETNIAPENGWLED